MQSAIQRIKIKVLFFKTLPPKTRDRWKEANGNKKQSVAQHQSTLMSLRSLLQQFYHYKFVPGIRARNVLRGDMEKDNEAFLLVFTKKSSRA